MQKVQNIDEKRVETAIQRGLTQLAGYAGMSKDEITVRVASLSTPDLIDLMLFTTKATAMNLPEESEAADTAFLLHMAARYFIYEPSAYDDSENISERLPIFRMVTAQYVDAIVNASEDDRAAMAMRYLGFAENTVSQVMAAHNRDDSEGIRVALDSDPASEAIRVSAPTVSAEEWRV